MATVPTTKSIAIGERIRKRRKELQLSLAELAAQTDLTASFLSLVERDINQPSLASLRRISDALKVTPSYFTQENKPHRVKSEVVRADSRIKMVFPPNDLTCELLTPTRNTNIEVFISHITPRDGNIATRPRDESEECIYVLQGQLHIALTDGDHHLNAGDSIYFHGDVLEVIEAAGESDSEVVFLVAVSPPIL